MLKKEINLFIILLWIYGSFGFLVDFFPTLLIPVKSQLFFLCDLMIIFLSIKHLRARSDYFFILTFLSISILSSFVFNKIDFITYINGIRDFIPFLFVPLLLKAFMRSTVAFSYFRNQMDNFILRFLQLQLPCSIYQFIIYGASDAVGGSMGQVGFSGILTQIVFLGTFHLLRKKIDKNNIAKSLWRNKIYFLFLIPSFINETKISFILLPLLFLLLLSSNRLFSVKTIVVIPAFVILITFFLSFVYLGITKSSSDIFTSKYYTEFYLFNDNSADYAQTATGYGEDIPRFSKMYEGYNLLVKEEKLLFGAGIGHFKGGTNLENTSFSIKYRWLLYGSIPYLFFIVIQIGIIGFIWIITFLGYHIKKGFNNRSKQSSSIIIYQIVIFLIILFYNDSFRAPIWGILFMYILMYPSYDKKKKIAITNK